jgi:hypothetical protein
VLLYKLRIPRSVTLATFASPLFCSPPSPLPFLRTPSPTTSSRPTSAPIPCQVDGRLILLLYPPTPNAFVKLPLIHASILGHATQNQNMQPNHVQQGRHSPPAQQNGYANNAPHGQNLHADGPAQNGSQAHRNPSQHPPREITSVLGIPSVTVENDQLVVGGSQSSECPAFPYHTLHRYHGPLICWSSFPSYVHTTQSRRRWLLWHGLVVRLAWDVTAQYTDVSYAVWSRRAAGIRGKEACCCEKDEEEMGRWLGRV